MNFGNCGDGECTDDGGPPNVCLDSGPGLEAMTFLVLGEGDKGQPTRYILTTIRGV